MGIKAWLKRRRELKQLEKQIDKKIESEGMYYMFNPKTNPYSYKQEKEK